jgi:glucosamine-6-phosphate deaminase
MDIVIMPDKRELGKAAAAAGASLLREALRQRGSADIIVATGASQFEMFDQLVQESDIAWQKVTAFHLDEYVGISITHPASFRRYLWERFASRLPLPLRAFHYLNAEDDPAAECRRVSDIIRHHPIDVAFVGIGENGHLAFNDPPADFEIDDPYIVVDLDEACRRQQLGEGWFPSLDDVPRHAISMSVRQIMKSRAIVCTVPDQRKAQAVRDAVEGDVMPRVPASILQHHDRVTLYLDAPAASLLSRRT